MAAPEGILEKKAKQTPCKNNWERKHFLPAKLYLLRFNGKNTRRK